MSWIVVGVENGIFWPREETKVSFRGYDLTLRPETDKWAPDIITQYGSTSNHDDALRVIRQFLSSLAWVRRGAIREIGTTGGSHPIHIGPGRRLGLGTARLIDPNFRLDYLPDPIDPRTRLALALYREALGVNSIAYQFLGFFKILNILHAKGSDQGRWINDTLDRLSEHDVKTRIATLRATKSDVGQYLWTSGRCAVAHAYSEPLLDPEDPEDLARLQLDLPLVKALAEDLIEHEFGVKSQRTILNEHLYELDGFREILGKENVSRLKSGSDLSLESFPSLPILSVRVRDNPNLPAFESMSPRIVAAEEGLVIVDCYSPNKSVLLRVGLDFAEERLTFDPQKGVLVSDDGSPTALRNAADHSRLMRALVQNGQLELWNAQSNTLLGRTDPLIPVNIDIWGTVQNLDRQISKFEQLALERETKK